MAETILIVDDVQETRELLKEALKVANYEIIEAVDGVDALEKAEKFLPNLILMDVTMPRMDGFTLNMKLKENEKTKNIPVIVSTSHKDMLRVFQSSDKTKIDGFIEKPYKIEEIWTIVDRILKK
ncbi:MAG: hypothetical protein A2474_08065 [Elusimicrobia bacterium RIFOXYC2_FULL_34_12]|nr:MAG: hypothetical protein A2474_08065 [Elusimicrobia bacterium RIFOXYC2_FULL_34_12]